MIIQNMNYFNFREGPRMKYNMAPNGIKITIKSIKILSFPSNLLLRISTMAMIGSNNTKMNIKGIKNNKDNIPILFVFNGL